MEDAAGSMLASFASYFMGNNQFDSKSRANLVNAPVLLMHGVKDTIAEMRHCFNLFGRV